MFINNNGVRIEVRNDSTINFAGKVYHDDSSWRLKEIETKLALFSEEEGIVEYDKLPTRLREKLNRSLTSLYDRLDQNKDEGFVAINHLRAFGFLGEDRERIKRAASNMNLIAYQMGLGSFEAAYERFKESERKSSSVKVDAARFIDDYIRNNDAADNYDFFKSELKKFGVGEAEIIKEYNSILFTKNKISEFMRLPKEERITAFIKDYKENEYSSFGYFSAAMQRFGVDNSDILKQYMEVGGNASKKIEDFYSAVYKDKIIPDREKIAKFVSTYKERGLNDYSLFSETLQDFGVTDTKEILLYFNDSVDESFKLSSREFSLVSAAKKELIDLQEQIIKDAVEAGLEAPSNLSRLVSPSDKIKDETINPQKIKMIASFDFADKSVDYNKSPDFGVNGEISGKTAALLNKNIALQLKVLQNDTNNSVGFANLTLIKNNGFSFDRMKEWALYNGENNIINPQKAMTIAITALKQCNKLVECGVLQSEDGKNFTFTTPRAREILFENPTATYNQLADMIIEEHGITFGDSKEKPLNRELFEEQKAEFEDFLDAQYKSYYAPQRLNLEDFRSDALAEESQEYQRYRDLYPELKRGMDFKDVVDDFVENDKFAYIRQSSIEFGSKEAKTKIDEAWGSAQKANLSISDPLSQEKNAAQRDFINLSAVKFDGIDYSKLHSWGEGVVKKGALSKSVADAFIASTMEQGAELCGAGIMVKNEKGFSFVDDYAKESLLLGYNLDIKELAKLNRGVKTERADLMASSPQTDSPSSPAAQASVGDEKKLMFEPSYALSREAIGVVDKLNYFNYSWRLSGDEKYRSMMEKIEGELKGELKMFYFGDEKFKEYLDAEVGNIQDSIGVKRFFFDEFYEEMSSTEKEDAKAVFAEILNGADRGQEVTHG